MLIDSRKKIFNKRNRVILKALVKTDYKLRYQGSVFGHLWDFIKPMVLFAIRAFIFGRLLGLGKGVTNFSFALLLATILWSFFQDTTTKGMTVLLSRKEMIKKANVYSLVIVLSSVVNNLINLGINLLVFGLFFVLSGNGLSVQMLLMIPIILELIILSVGLALLLSSIYVYFKDIEALWSILLQLTMYMVPIIFPIDRIMEYDTTIASILMLNPLAQIIQDSRHLILGVDHLSTNQVIGNPMASIIPYMLPMVIFIIGWIVFNKYSRKFAEIL